MYVIVNRELRQIVQEFETREEADADALLARVVGLSGQRVARIVADQ
jgi:hypothetical protein